MDVMKIEYDSAADAAYIRLGEGQVAKTAEIGDDVLVDFDASGRVLGIEVLWLQRRGLRAGQVLVETLREGAGVTDAVGEQLQRAINGG